VFHDAANLSVSRFLRLVSGSRPNTRSNEVEEFDSQLNSDQNNYFVFIFFIEGTHLNVLSYESKLGFESTLTFRSQLKMLLSWKIGSSPSPIGRMTPLLIFFFS
jgi:hypothetical protein